MKKTIAILLSTILAISAATANSYTNNTYQVLAKEYTDKAQKALDAGEYDLSEEYAAKAKENAELSDQYIKSMLARDVAEKDLNAARNRLEYVSGINGAQTYPIAFEAATNALTGAEEAFKAENWESTSSYAKQVLDTLADIKEITPLPKYYVVRPWASDKDCFWNISARPYVYKNPWLWENLYQSNKKKLPRKDDPNIIIPRMKMEIPSINGEFRDGTYDSKKTYE